MGFYDPNGFYTPDEPPVKKKDPEWVDAVDYNPDHRASTSPKWVEPTEDGSYRYVLVVQGLGVVVMRAISRADDPLGRLEFKGVSVLTDGEIGHRT